MKKVVRSKHKVLVYTVTYFEATSTKLKTKEVRGIAMNLSEHQENGLFYIQDEFSMDVFAIPYCRLVECVAKTAVKEPRKPRTPKTTKKPATVTAIKARA